MWFLVNGKCKSYLICRLQHKDVFELIHKHNLYCSIHDMIEGLMDLDTDQAINLFLEKDHVSPDIVVSRLENNRKYLYLVKYISFFINNHISEFINMLIPIFTMYKFINYN